MIGILLYLLVPEHVSKPVLELYKLFPSSCKPQWVHLQRRSHLNQPKLPPPEIEEMCVLFYILRCRMIGILLYLLVPEHVSKHILGLYEPFLSSCKPQWAHLYRKSHPNQPKLPPKMENLSFFYIYAKSCDWHIIVSAGSKTCLWAYFGALWAFFQQLQTTMRHLCSYAPFEPSEFAVKKPPKNGGKLQSRVISISLYLLVPDNVFEHILEVYEHFSDRNKPH